MTLLGYEWRKLARMPVLWTLLHQTTKKPERFCSGFRYFTPRRRPWQSPSPLLSKNSAFPWNSVFR